MNDVKFIFMTDTHGRTNNPVSRKDNFPETILNKIAWVIDYANSIDAQILHGGDWVNRPDTSPAYVSKMCTLFKRAKYPILGILGNHDIYGYNPDTYYRTPLHIASACGAFSILSEAPLNISGTNIFISGANSTGLIDKNGRTAEYYTPRRLMPKETGEVRIHIVHGFLTDHTWPEGVPYTLIDAVKDTDADILLTGHEHTGYGIMKENDTIFCNPGALGRVSASVGDVNREVRVAEITVEDGVYDVELIPLPEEIARPSDEVLDRAALEEEKAAAARIETFAQQIEQINMEESEGLSLNDTMAYIHQMLSENEVDGIKITDSIRKMTLNYIGRAEQLEQESREKLKSE